jgi:hypothetical protein
MLRMKRRDDNKIEWQHLGPHYDEADVAAQTVAQQAEASAKRLAEGQRLHFPEIVMLAGDHLQNRAMELVAQEQGESLGPET